MGTSGALNPAYLGTRSDVLALVSSDCRRVLDVGCSTGALGAQLKRRPEVEVVGLELLPQAAEHAAQVLDDVLVGDVERLFDDPQLSGERFDTIIMADVLEHLQDPWAALRKASGMLTAEGQLIASLPNVRHISTLFSLVVLGRWPYRERGIHDRTHLRFFARRNICELFEQAGLRIERTDVTYRVIETPHWINAVAKYLALPGLREFLAFQYLVRATRR